jgi:hypothetical protein
VGEAAPAMQVSFLSKSSILFPVMIVTFVIAYLLDLLWEHIAYFMLCRHLQGIIKI